MAEVFESLRFEFRFRPEFVEGPRETLVFRSPKERLEFSFRPKFVEGLRETLVFESLSQDGTRFRKLEVGL